MNDISMPLTATVPADIHIPTLVNQRLAIAEEIADAAAAWDELDGRTDPEAFLKKPAVAARHQQLQRAALALDEQIARAREVARLVDRLDEERVSVEQQRDAIAEHLLKNMEFPSLDDLQDLWLVSLEANTLLLAIRPATGEATDAMDAVRLLRLEIGRRYEAFLRDVDRALASGHRPHLPPRAWTEHADRLGHLMHQKE